MVKIPKLKKCPRCNKKKSISKFGLRKMKPKDKVKVPQSYCIECRSIKTVKKKAVKPKKKK